MLRQHYVRGLSGQKPSLRLENTPGPRVLDDLTSLNPFLRAFGLLRVHGSLKIELFALEVFEVVVGLHK